MKDSIQSLRQTLDEWKSGKKTVAELVSQFRAFYSVSGLPEKYGVALEGVLGRVESSSLFTEESCSFSQKDLIDALIYWIDKAEQQL